MSTNDLRKKFIQFFKEREHMHLPSSPVVPENDPSLLFINAGMNQFKDIFLGKRAPNCKRAVTAQKCIRVGGKHNDLDNVGHTARHMTFFEMLGNFSFGDYFKKEAIKLAFDVTTEVFELPLNKLWVSVFDTDDEAFEIWSELIDPKRIVRMGEKENFWSMGATGPCGPCSELLFDRGPAYGDAPSPLAPGGEDRYPEFWNLVFMESNRAKDGSLTPLPFKNIDTGAGLERIIAFKEGLSTVFETDVLRSLIGEIERISKVKYDPKNGHDAPAFHVIADHLRALCFAIADGAVPSNTERGFVLRKILRRAMRYAKRLHLNDPFMANLVPKLCDLMGEAYPELIHSKERTLEILTLEEEGFLKTLKRGGNILSQVIDKAEKTQGRQISGEDAFKLKDTYGFPLEEILLLAKDNDLRVNLDAYEILEKKAKERSRGVKAESQEAIAPTLLEGLNSEFVGYDHLTVDTTVLALIVGDTLVDTMEEGQKGMIVLSQSPFYAEMGGQVGDIGDITHKKAHFNVTDTKSPVPGVIVHHGLLKKGTLLKGEPVTASVDGANRKGVANHHSATHLLHWALERVLGPHAAQRGSYVGAHELRFDLSHHKALTDDEIRTVEELINQKVRENLPITTTEKRREEAEKDPKIKQIFGEKYGETVRVVNIGDVSFELCGGTHTDRTGSLGYFRILEESSVGAGMRRLKGACGALSEKRAYDKEDLLAAIGEKMGVSVEKILPRLTMILEEGKELKSALKELRKAHIESLSCELIAQTDRSVATPVITAKVDVASDELAPLGNTLMDNLGSGIILLALAKEGRCQLLLKVSPDQVEKGHHANQLIRKVGPLIGGGGGGKKDAAQAGGKNPAGIEAAFEKLRQIVCS